MRPLLALASLATAAAAQGWAIPDGGTVRWTREFALVTAAADGAAHANSDLRLWQVPSSPHNPPLLGAWQLDRQREAEALPPRDLRDLCRWIAFDLRRAGSRRRERFVAPALQPFGDLHVDARFAAAGDDGSQRIACEVHREEPEPPPGETADRYREHVGRACSRDLRGRIEIERRLEGGLVAEFRATFHAEVDGPDAAAPPGRFTITERWHEPRVLAARGGLFEQRVADAILAARARVREQLGDPATGDTADQQPPPADGRTYNTGRLALICLTLIKAGLPLDDEALAGALAEVRRRRPLDTYSLAMCILAIEAVYTPPTEAQALREGAIERPLPRSPNDEDRAAIAAWVERLLDNRDLRVPADRVRRWSYGPQAAYDNSNTQYAVLGLYAAHLCGVTVSAEVWQLVARHFLDDAREGDGKVTLAIVARHELATAARRTAGARRVTPVGWPYSDDGRSPTASMTAGAVGSLAICRAVLDELRRRTPSPRELEAATRGGLAWLAEHWQPHYNAGHPSTWNQWRGYYLYAVERGLELNHVGLLQGRDWYAEGAEYLMAIQSEHGDLGGDVSETCFGLLFLKQTALPVYTGR